MTFIGGLYFFLEYLLPEEIHGVHFNAYHEEILKALQIVSISTIGLGIINIFTVYGTSILRARKGWPNALALMTGFLLMMVFECVNMFTAEEVLKARQDVQLLTKFGDKIISDKDLTAAARTEKLQLLKDRVHALAQTERLSNPVLRRFPKSALELTEEQEFIQAASRASAAIDTVDFANPDLAQTIAELKLTGQAAAKFAQKSSESTFSALASNFVQEAFWMPLTAAIFSLLAFFMATAAYRAFRIRSLEAALIMGSALLVILGQIPHGPLYISEALPGIRLWLLKNVNTPAFRAIYFGSTVAGLALAVRIWFSLERSPLDRES